MKEPYRDFLFADLALILGIASARDVAFALQRFWEHRDEGGSILPDLRTVAGLSDADVERLEEEVENLVREAGGDPRLALGARGGMDRTIHLELSRAAAPMVGEIVREGAGVRSPLRAITNERYLGFQEIGRGGMGVVYLALDTELNRRVALKVVRPAMAATPADSPLAIELPPHDTPASEAFRLLTTRFLQEAWVTGGLEHPGVVPVYELGRTPAGVPFYTMRFVKGERTLKSAIDRANTLEERLGLLEHFLRVCDTLAYAHSRGVIHRDLKPANIALGEFGEVVVLDWGLAKIQQRPDLADTSWKGRIEELREVEDLQTLAGGLGTPGYMSPEAVVGAPEEIDEQSDVYSLGAVLYEILTGRLPFTFRTFPELVLRLLEDEPTPPQDIVPEMPGPLSRICLSALERDPARRPRGAGQLAKSIRRWQRESAVDREVDGLLERARSAWSDVEGLSGNVLLRKLDRVLGLAHRVTELRPGDEGASAIALKATGRRKEAIAERERMARRALLRRVAVVGLILALLAAGASGWVLRRQQQEAENAARRAEEAAHRAEEQRDAKVAALSRAQVLGLVSASADAGKADPTLSLLLAREAVLRSREPATITRLHGAMTDYREVRVLRGHEAVITGLAISPDESLIVTCSHDETARLWDWEGRLLAVLPHSAAASNALFLPTGNGFLTQDWKTVRRWRADGSLVWELSDEKDPPRLLATPHGPFSWKLLPEGGVVLHDAEKWPNRVFRWPDRKVTSLCISADGSRILASTVAGAHRIWTWTGDLIGEFQDEEHPTRMVTLSPDGTLVAASSADGKGRLYSLEGKLLLEVEVPGNPVNAFRFSPDGLLLLSSHARQRVLRLWDRDGNVLAILRGHPYVLYQVRFSPSGSHVLTSSRDGTARLWDLQGNEVAVLRDHYAPVYSAMFSPSGRWILTGAQDNNARLWRSEAGEGPILRGHRRPVSQACFSPDGHQVVTASWDGTARIWSREGELLAELIGHEDEVVDACFSPDGGLVATASRDGVVRLWLTNGRPVHCLGIGESTGSRLFARVLFSPDGTLLAGEAGTERILVWDRDGRLRHSVDTGRGQVLDLSFSPDGRSLVLAIGRAAKLVSLDGSGQTEFIGHQDTVLSARVSPGGDRVLTSSRDGTARLWDISGRQIAQFGLGSASVAVAQFLPDGRTVLVVGEEGRMSRFDLAGRELESFPEARIGGRRATVSPDGRMLATVGTDDSITIWTTDGREVGTVGTHAALVSSVSFSPDGRQLLTSSWDRTARLWILDTAELIERAESRLHRDFTDAERARYGALLR